MINIPPEFWQTLSDAEYASIGERGTLNRRLCRRLWAMLGRTDKSPHQLMIMFDREDVMREFPPITKQ